MITLTNQRARGLDAIGQRLILLGGTLLVLVVTTLPGAAVGAVVWFALRSVVGAVAPVPAAAAFTAVIAIEVLLISEMLGPVYERLDLTAIEHVN